MTNMSAQNAQFIDSHCHLNDPRLLPHLPQIIENAHQAGVIKMLNMSCSWQDALQTVATIQQYPSVFGAIGVQPYEVDSFTPDQLPLMEQMIVANPKIVAIGEIGLDAYGDRYPDFAKQQHCFEAFLSLAMAHHLPVVVHVRNCHDAVLAAIAPKTKQGLKGVIHCFTGTKEQAKDFLDAGFFISLAGVVTFKNAKDLWEVAQYIPQDRLLIETDSPYLAPMPHRGHTNQPAYIANTAAFIAQLRHQDLLTFADDVLNNTQRLFWPHTGH